jgi:hypothetical protein
MDMEAGGNKASAMLDSEASSASQKSKDNFKQFWY